MPHPHSAIELDPQWFRRQQFAERRDPFTIESEEIIVDVEVANSESRSQILHVPVDILGGVIPEPLLKYRPIAIGTLEGASPAGDHGGTGRHDIAEQR